MNAYLLREVIADMRNDAECCRIQAEVLREKGYGSFAPLLETQAEKIEKRVAQLEKVMGIREVVAG